MAPEVLIVDDEPSLLETLALILDASGYHATACSSVAEAVQAVAAGHYDALLADVGMPGGAQAVLAAMRAAHPRALVVLLTGCLTAEAIPAEVRALAGEVVFKPTDIPALLDLLRRNLLQ